MSAIGVLMLLTLVYGMLWMIVFRSENKVVSARQLLVPLVAGFGMALLQIAILDLLRFAITGSWDGFHLG